MADRSDLEIWLDSTDEKRGELLAYSRSPIPSDPGQRQADISKALALAQDAGDLLSDMDKFLTDLTAQAILQIEGDYSSDERKALVKAKVSGVTRLRDGLKVLYGSIRERRFCLMSISRW